MAVLLFCCGLGLIGIPIARIFGPHSSWRLLILGFPFGLGIFSILLYLGNNFLLIRLNQATVLILFLALVLPAASPYLRSFEPAHRRYEPALAVRTRVQREISPVIGLLVAVFVLLGLAVFLAPTRGWDPFLYHLPYAESLFRSGYRPQDISPSVGHMEYAYPPLLFYFFASEWLLIGSVEHVLPRFVHILFLTATAILLFDLAVNHFKLSKIASLSAVALLLSFPAIQVEAFRQNTDIPLVYYGLCGFYALLQYLARPKPVYLLLCGFNLALACWVKYTGLLVALALGAALLGYSVFRNTSPKSGEMAVLPALGSVTFTCLAVFAPFLIINWTTLGNPVYPLLARSLGGYQINSWTLEWVLPFSISGRLFSGTSGALIALFGTPLAALALAGIFSWKDKRDPRWQIGVLGLSIFTGLWFALMGHPNGGDPLRFYFAMLPILAVFAATTVDKLISGQKAFSVLTGGAFLASLVGYALYLAYKNKLGWPAAWPTSIDALTGWIEAVYRPLGLSVSGLTMILIAALVRLRGGSSRAHLPALPLLIALLLIPVMLFSAITISFAASGLPAWSDRLQSISGILKEDASWMESNLPAAARLMTFENRRYLIPREIFLADRLELKPFYDSQDPAAASEVLKDLGIEYIYINGTHDRVHPLISQSILLQNAQNIKSLALLYSSPDGQSKIYRVSWP